MPGPRPFLTAFTPYGSRPGWMTSTVPAPTGPKPATPMLTRLTLISCAQKKFENVLDKTCRDIIIGDYVGQVCEKDMIEQGFLKQMICIGTRPGACFGGSDGLGHARNGSPPEGRPRVVGNGRLEISFRSHRSLYASRQVLMGAF